MAHDIEIFFPVMDECERGKYIRAHLPVSFGLPQVSCGWTSQGTWYMDFPVSKPRYVLHYYEPGKRPNTERQAKRDVNSVQEAIDFMNANKDTAFLPASVKTRAWSPEVIAILQ